MKKYLLGVIAAMTLVVAMPVANASAAPYLSKYTAKKAVTKHEHALGLAMEDDTYTLIDWGTDSCSRLSRSSFYCSGFASFDDSSLDETVTCTSDYRVTKKYSGIVRVRYISDSVDCEYEG